MEAVILSKHAAHLGMFHSTQTHAQSHRIFVKITKKTLASIILISQLYSTELKLKFQTRKKDNN